MLSILHHLEARLGRRWYLIILALAVLGVFALEYTGLGTGFYAFVNHRAIAENAEALQLATAQEKAALAQEAVFKAETAKQVAINAAQRQQAEQEEKTWLAKKAAADAETAKQIAINAAQRQQAEQEEKTWLAKKAAADAETSRQIALNSPVRQNSETRSARAKASVDEAAAWVMTGQLPDDPPPTLRCADAFYRRNVARGTAKPAQQSGAMVDRSTSLFDVQGGGGFLTGPIDCAALTRNARNSK